MLLYSGSKLLKISFSFYLLTNHIKATRSLTSPLLSEDGLALALHAGRLGQAGPGRFSREAISTPARRGHPCRTDVAPAAPVDRAVAELGSDLGSVVLPFYFLQKSHFTHSLDEEVDPEGSRLKAHRCAGWGGPGPVQ